MVCNQYQGFPGGTVVKNLPANGEDSNSTPGLGRSSGGGNDNPTPVFLPGKFHGLRNPVGYSPWGGKESDTAEQLSTNIIYFHVQLSQICHWDPLLSGVLYNFRHVIIIWAFTEQNYFKYLLMLHCFVPSRWWINNLWVYSLHQLQVYKWTYCLFFFLCVYTYEYTHSFHVDLDKRKSLVLCCKTLIDYSFFKKYKFIYFNWRLITLQYCIGFAIHGHESATGVDVSPHPETPSQLPSHLIPLGHPSAPALNTL